MSADGPSPYAYMPRRKRNHSDSDEDHLDNLPYDFSDVSSEGEEAVDREAVKTRPIAICRVLRVFSDGRTDRPTDRPTDRQTEDRKSVV